MHWGHGLVSERAYIEVVVVGNDLVDGGVLVGTRHGEEKRRSTKMATARVVRNVRGLRVRRRAVVMGFLSPC